MKYNIQKITDGHRAVRSDGRIVSICTGEGSEELAALAIRRDKKFPQTKGRKVLYITEKKQNLDLKW